MREYFMAAHEELIQEYLEAHPESTEEEAYDKTADLAYDRMVNKLADMADNLRDQHQEDI